MRWITADATPSRIGLVGWADRTYIRLDATDVAHDFTDADGRQPGIADKELMGLITGSVAGLSSHPGVVLFIGVGNLNAV